MVVTVIKDGKERKYNYDREHLVKAVEVYTRLKEIGEIDSFYFEIV